MGSLASRCDEKMVSCIHSFVFIDSREARADARAGRETFVDAGFVRWFGSRDSRGGWHAIDRSINRLIFQFIIAFDDDAVRCVCGHGSARGGGWVQRMRDVRGDGGAAERARGRVLRGAR